MPVLKLTSITAAALLLLVTAIYAQSPVTPPPADAAPPPKHPIDHHDPSVLYEDSSAQSSATVTQILPNSNTSLLTFGAVRRIRVQQDILIIEWSDTAVTMLPRQYVGSLTVNKRTANSPPETVHP